MASEGDASEMEVSPPTDAADAAPSSSALQQTLQQAAVESATPPEEESSKEEVAAEAEGESNAKEEIVETAEECTTKNPEPESDVVEDSDKSTKITEEEPLNDEAPIEEGEKNEEVTQDEADESADNTEAESNGVDENDTPKITVDDVKTAPIDFRFPTTNQAKHCFTRYNEYHKCIKEKGEDTSDCEKYARWYRSLCPGEWIERWNEQRENGTFPGRY